MKAQAYNDIGIPAAGKRVLVGGSGLEGEGTSLKMSQLGD